VGVEKKILGGIPWKWFKGIFSLNKIGQCNIMKVCLY